MPVRACLCMCACTNMCVHKHACVFVCMCVAWHARVSVHAGDVLTVSGGDASCSKQGFPARGLQRWQKQGGDATRQHPKIHLGLEGPWWSWGGPGTSLAVGKCPGRIWGDAASMVVMRVGTVGNGMLPGLRGYHAAGLV